MRVRRSAIASKCGLQLVDANTLGVNEKSTSTDSRGSPSSPVGPATHICLLCGEPINQADQPKLRPRIRVGSPSSHTHTVPGRIIDRS